MPHQSNVALHGFEVDPVSTPIGFSDGFNKAFEKGFEDDAFPASSKSGLVDGN